MLQLFLKKKPYLPTAHMLRSSLYFWEDVFVPITERHEEEISLSVNKLCDTTVVTNYSGHF